MTKDEVLNLALKAFGEIAWSNETHWQSVRARSAINEIKEYLAQPVEEKLHPVHIGVDVTSEGTAVTAFYRKPDSVMEVFYAQFHPLTHIEQPKVRVGDCLRVGVCASEGHKIQAQRTWIELTDEDVTLLCNTARTHEQTWGMFVRTIEAKLKEKNAQAS
jgi:hypothetical protein